MSAAGSNSAPQNVRPDHIGAVDVDGDDNASLDTGLAPFVCGVCEKRYTRVDHLARHHRSHTREKPFRCETCGKNFARLDLLKRHATNHKDGDDERPRKRQKNMSPSTSLPVRVSQACHSCAAAKLKCEEMKPCQRCVQKNIECLPLQPTNSISQAQDTRSVLDPRLQEGSMDLPEPSSIEIAPVAQQRPNVHFSHDLNFPEVGARQPNQMGPLPTLSEPAPSQQTLHKPDHVSPLATQLHSQSHAPGNPGNQLDFVEDMSFMPDDSSLGDFLNHIFIPMTPGGMNPAVDPFAMSFIQNPPDMLDFNPRDMMDFRNDLGLDLTAVDMDMIDTFQHARIPMVPNTASAAIEPHDKTGPPSRDEHTDINELGHEAFGQSLWRFAPGVQDRSFAETEYLVLPPKDTMNNLAGTGALTPGNNEGRFTHRCRDRVLAMIMNAWDSSISTKIVLSFPRTEFLENLILRFLEFHESKLDSWLHLGTFRPENTRAELLAALIAAGAILHPLPVIQRLGLAIQETARLSLVTQFEADNSSTRDLQMWQTYSLILDIGLWSGDKRKSEIAEAQVLPLFTMSRRAGLYRRTTNRPLLPTPEDDYKQLQDKWHTWVQAESRKRLAFHSLIADAQTSISFLRPPLLSFTEVSVDLPASASLWQARDAQSWRIACLSRPPQGNASQGRLPSLTQCVYDLQPLIDTHDFVDWSYSTIAILHRTWSMIWDYRQLSSAQRLYSHQGSMLNGSLISSSWHKDLLQLLTSFRLTLPDLEPLPVQAVLVEELLLLNLYMSFEELQIFAGKDGIDDARRVYPILRQWYDRQDSRQAVVHAGQVIRAARAMPLDHLRDFYAIAVYHAGLTFWAYSILSARRDPAKPLTGDIVILDGGNSAEKFVQVGRGIPAICRNGDEQGGQSGQPRSSVPLGDLKTVMEIITGILHANCGNQLPVPPIVENLSRLMRELGNAVGKLKVRP